MFSKPLSVLMTSVSCLTGLFACSSPSVDEDTLKRLYSSPLAYMDKPLNVFHLGHSLVGRDMPVMLKQLACCKHDFRSQLGWGSSLQSHWEPEIPINGFKSENAHSGYQDVFESINSKAFDAFVLTESVEIKDAIKYHDSAGYLALFAKYIHQNSPDSRIYLYESWHEVTDKAGWIERLDTDYPKFWIKELLDPALMRNQAMIPIYLIPVGQVMSKLFHQLALNKTVEGISGPEDIFARNDDGSLDPIHMNDIGNYLVALVHYAVLYHKSPIGLKHELLKADGSSAIAPTIEVARLMQTITWEVVSSNFRTGLTGY